jgi:hypothetical protein
MTGQIWLAVSGGSADTADPTWGGCQVWVSVDEVNYLHVGDVTQPARTGVLAQALPGIVGYNPAVPDTGNVLKVDLGESGGTLSSGATADAIAGRTLCYVADGSGGGELISYVTATLTAPGQYTLSTLYRAQYGTQAVAHALGSQFARLDSAVFQYDVPDSYIGQTLYVKLVSFNIWGQGLQDISTVTPVAYVVQGTALDFSTSPFMSILYGGGSISLGDLGQPVAATFACGDLGVAPIQTLQLGSL